MHEAEPAAEFGIDAQFESLAQALEGAAFDAVVITTPTPTHLPLAVEAAEHGKHVFLEKPMAISLEECDLIIGAAERNGVALQLGFMRRFDPQFAAAAQRIEAGEIGQPMMIKSLTHGPGLPPPWARDLRTSNGLLAEVNSHDWDTVRWLMGSNYERIYCRGGQLQGRRQQHRHAQLLRQRAGQPQVRERRARPAISGICPCGYGYDARVEIVGEKGIMQIGELKGQAIVACTDRDQGLISPIFKTWPERFQWGYIYEMEHFVDCDPPRCAAQSRRRRRPLGGRGRARRHALLPRGAPGDAGRGASGVMGLTQDE